MSNLVKGVKKVFKKTVQVVKKIAPYVAMAAAIYFTAGLAMAAFPATAGVAAAMPGITGAASALGIGSAAAATAAPTFAGAAESLGVTAAADSGAAAASAVAAEAGISATAAPAAIAAAAPLAAAAPAAAAPAAGLFAKLSGVIGKTATAVSGMSFTDKLLLASVGAQTLGNYLGPTADEIARDQAIEKAKWRGAFYGMDDNGQPGPANPTGVRPLPGPGTIHPNVPNAPAVPSVTQPTQPTAAAPRDLFAPAGATNLLPSIGGVGTRSYAQLASNFEDTNA